MSEHAIGDLVIAHYKTGKYVGEITNIRSNGYIVVKILAVLKHPMQGDLHHPKQTEGRWCRVMKTNLKNAF